MQHGSTTDCTAVVSAVKTIVCCRSSEQCFHVLVSTRERLLGTGGLMKYVLALFFPFLEVGTVAVEMFFIKIVLYAHYI